MHAEQIKAYLRHKIPAASELAVGDVRRVMGGFSKETWAFDARWRENGSTMAEGFILRRDPDASNLVTDRSIEFNIYRALQDTAIPVPRVRWMEPDPRWLERPFFVMKRIDGGEALPNPLVSDKRYAPVRPEIGRRTAEILAQIHTLDWASLHLDFLTMPAPDQCAQLEIAKWEQILNQEELEPQPILRGGIQWLKEHLPRPPARLSLVHGDYRTGNFLYTPDGQILAMLDWEMVHLGDPMEDIGWLCMRPWYWGTSLIGGLLEREEFYRLYERYSGITVDREAVRFWELLGNLKLAVIGLTGGRSFCDGRTQNLGMARSGRGADRLSLNVLDLMGVGGDCL